MILIRDQRPIRVRPAVTKKLPGVAHFADQVKIQISDDQRIFVPWAFGNKLPPRIAKITLTVEFADVPGLFMTDAVYGTNEVSIRNCMGRLLQTPQILRKPGYCRRWIKNNLGAVQTQCASAFRKVAIVTDVDPDARKSSIKCWIAQITWPEIEFLPESGIDMRYVILPVLAQVLAVSIDHGGGVVINARDFFLINRHDDYHAVLFGHFLHQPNGWAIRNLLHCVIPARLLFSAKVRRCENFLHAKNLHALLGGLFDEAQVLLDVEPFDIFNRQIRWRGIRCLNKSTFDGAGHAKSLPSRVFDQTIICEPGLRTVSLATRVLITCDLVGHSLARSI